MDQKRVNFKYMLPIRCPAMHNSGSLKNKCPKISIKTTIWRNFVKQWVSIISELLQVMVKTGLLGMGLRDTEIYSKL